MTQERVDIIIREKGSRVVKRNLEDIGKSAQKSGDGVDFLKRALIGLGAALSINQITKTIDAYGRLQNQLRVAGFATTQLADATDRLQTIANATRQSVEATGTLYGRLAGASKELGASQEQLFTFVQAVGSALAVNGTEAGTAAGVLLQLSQAMGGAVIQAQEFNSVVDGARPLLAAVAKNIDGAGGSVSRLKALVNEGKVSSQAFFQAVLKGAPEIEAKLGKSVLTIGQSLQVLSNQWTVYIGRLSEATGASETISGLILSLSANLDTVAKAALGASSGLLLVGGSSKTIDLATAAVVRLNAAIARNPVGLLLIVLTSVVTSLTLFRDQINLGVDDVTTLGDVMRALGETFSAAFGTIWHAAQATFGPLTDLVSGFVGDVDLSITGILRLAAKGADTFAGVWRAAINVLITLFEKLPATLGDLMTRALNVLLGRISAFVNDAGQLLGTVTEFAGLGKIATVDLRLTNENKGAAAKFGKDLGDAVSNGFRDSHFAQDSLDKIIARAQRIGKDRAAAGGGQGAPGTALSPPPGQALLPPPDATKNATEGSAKLQSALDSLVGSYDRVWAAQQTYTDGIALLEQAESSHLISAQRAAQVVELMGAQMKDALDPMGAVNRELERQGELLKLTADQRTVANKARSIQQGLLGQGIILNEKELEQLRERLSLLQQDARISDARNQIIQETIGKQQDFQDQLTAINGLIADGTLTRQEANAALVEQNQSLLEGTIEAQQAMVTNYEQTLEQIDLLRQADLIKEQTAAQLKARANADLNAQQLSGSQKFFGSLAGLSRSKNRELAAIGKAAAITKATIDGVVAVQKALASAPPPANIAAAAVAGAMAAANVAKIVSTPVGFQTGGSFVVGGQGGPDSQAVSFRATPGETVSVARPEQVRKGNPFEGGASPPVQNNTQIVNVLDPALVGDYLSTSDGEQVLVNVMRRNSDSMRQIVSEA